MLYYIKTESETIMDIFDEALIFATEKHSGQTRRENNAPYIVHPIEAATVVSTMSGDRELLAAALLHDVIEDAGVTADELRERFGSRVTELVLSETEDKRVDRPPTETWQIRKAESLELLKNTEDIAVKMLWMGDKLSNMRSFYRLYLEKGNDLWQGFHQKDPKVQAWYYRTVAEYLADLKGYAAYNEYVYLVNKIFENV